MDKSVGEYMTLGELLVSFGGSSPELPTWESSVTACANYMESCRGLGGQWIIYNEMAIMITYFRVRQQHMSMVTEKYHIRESEMTKAETADSENPKAPKAVEPPQTPERSQIPGPAPNTSTKTKCRVKKEADDPTKSFAVTAPVMSSKPCKAAFVVALRMPELAGDDQAAR